VWETIKQRFRSKTYWAAVVMAGLSILEVNLGMFAETFGSWYPMFYVGMSLIFMLIREATNAPLSDKK
jgi:hypothetical protein